MVIDLTNIQWKEFPLKSIFELCLSLGDNQAKLLPEGKMPLVSAGTSNNAICKFIKHGDDKSQLFPPNVITVDMFGKVFYQPTQFYAVSHGRINILIPKIKFNKFIGIFIAQILENRFRNKFSYSIMCNQNRLLKEKIMLPVNSKGEPDYKFMEEYIKERESKFKEQYKEHANKLVANLKKKIDKKVNWNNFPIADIFDIKSGKRLTKADMKIGNTPFISAADNNNGVTNFISNSNESLDKNVLGVNYDGNGGMVISFYHPYDCIFSDSVKRFHFKNTKDNKYAFLFAKVSILKQRDKYRYGYKFNETRMKKQQIMLPVDSKGEPDYKFMEDYMKYLEQKKLLEYLDYVK